METTAHHSESEGIKPVRPLRRRVWPAFVVLFIAGFVAGALLIMLAGKHTPVQPGIKVAAEVGVLSPAAEVDSLLALEPLRYESPLARATFHVKYGRKTVEVKAVLYSMYPMKALVEFDMNSLSVMSVRQINVNDQTSALIGAGLVQVANVGDNTYQILLENRNTLPQKINFRLLENDQPVFQGALTINRE